MKIETREDALLHCFDLWLWLTVNPFSRKDRWVGWEDNGGYLEAIINDCPVCEYMEAIKEDPLCENCTIKWGARHCTVRGSAYRAWRDSKTEEDRKKWALEIAILALEAL